MGRPRTRTVIAAVLAPLLAALLFCILWILFDVEPTLWAFVWFVYAPVVGYSVVIVLGIPAYRWLCGERRTRIWYLVALGAALSIPAIIVDQFLLRALVFLHDSSATQFVYRGVELSRHIHLLPVVMLLGAVAGLIFWLIARPDRT